MWPAILVFFLSSIIKILIVSAFFVDKLHNSFIVQIGPIYNCMQSFYTVLYHRCILCIIDSLDDFLIKWFIKIDWLTLDPKWKGDDGRGRHGGIFFINYCDIFHHICITFSLFNKVNIYSLLNSVENEIF